MLDGVGEVQDFMPPPQSGTAAHLHRMIRRVLAVRGQVRFIMDMAPRFNYARARHDVALTPHGALVRSPELELTLSTRCPLEIVDGVDVHARIELPAGEMATFVLDQVEPGEMPVPYTNADIEAQFDVTVSFWRGWLRRSRYSGRWREMVHRSALTLKLLTYAPTGAIVAAPTTSLPEELGGTRNWDYRYIWMRDAAFSLYGLLRLGFTEEAGAFMQWLVARFRHAADCESGPLQIMYGIDGGADLPEEELKHLEGYMRSAPVRIGNGAATDRRRRPDRLRLNRRAAPCELGAPRQPRFRCRARAASTWRGSPHDRWTASGTQVHWEAQRQIQLDRHDPSNRFADQFVREHGYSVAVCDGQHAPIPVPEAMRLSAMRARTLPSDRSTTAIRVLPGAPANRHHGQIPTRGTKRKHNTGPRGSISARTRLRCCRTRA
jgi:hypothetical protein